MTKPLGEMLDELARLSEIQAEADAIMFCPFLEDKEEYRKLVKEYLSSRSDSRVVDKKQQAE